MSTETPNSAIAEVHNVTPGQRAALDLSANRVISASAGTGKTFTLTTLYMGLLTGRLSPGHEYLDKGEWLSRSNAGTLSTMRPEEIVAVTFTEKAAAELRDRARGAIEDVLKNPELGDGMREHLRRCAFELPGAPVTTIHAFCAQLLRDAGAEGPVPAAFEQLEQDESDKLLHAAFSSAAAEMLDSGKHPFIEKLAATWGVFSPNSGLVVTGEKMLRFLRSRGRLPGALREISSSKRLSLAQIARKLETLYDAVARPMTGRSKVKPETLAFCAQRKIPATLEDARLLALDLSPQLNFAWARNNNIDDPCAEIVYAANGPYVEAFSEYVELALAKYAEAKRAAGAVDFDDLLLAARKLMAEHPTNAYSFVLIDEFQDTNPLQKEILWQVAFGGQTPTPGARLCVVGDVKQSIYRFRGADVSLMQQAEKEFLTTPLQENFRSRRKVIDFINGFCATIFAPGFYNENHELLPMPDVKRHAWEGPPGEVLCWDEDDIGNADEHRLRQAQAIARRIRTLVAPAPNSTLTRPVIFDRKSNLPRKDVRFGDIAILAGSLKHLRQPLQLALKQMQIPFQMLGGVSFFTRQEVIDVTNLWAAACNPGDAYAVAGLLRSPFIGLSDAGLWRLSEMSAEGAAKEILRRAFRREIR